MPFAVSTDTAGPWVELVVQGQANLLSTFDSGSTASGSTGTWAGTGCAVLETGPTAPDGSFPIRFTSVGAGNISAVTGNYAVVPEQVYTGVLALQTAVTGRSTQAQLVWKDAGGATISTSSGLYSSDTAGAYTLATVTDDAPPNAAFVALQVVLLATANAEVHYAASRAILPGSGTLWSPGGNAGLETALVQSSDDQGATWQTLRYGLNVALPAPSQQAKVTDWEPTPNIARLYRATISDPNGHVSVATTPVEAVVSPDRCWFIDVLQPDAGGRLGFYRARAGGGIAGVGSSFTWTQVEQQTKLQPLKDPTSPAEVPPLILRGGIQAPTTSILIYLPGQAAKNAFKALRARQRTLLLQTDGYENEYVSIDGQVTYDQVRAGDRTYNPTWIATVPLTATAAP